MNVLEDIARNVEFGEDNLEKSVDDYYKRYLTAFRNQYAIGTPLRKLSFLALDARCIMALKVMPGSLVRNKPSGKYCVVDGWKMFGKCAILEGHDKDGVKVLMDIQEFEKADIPSDIMEMAKLELKAKCPLMGGCETEP